MNNKQIQTGKKIISAAITICCFLLLLSIYLFAAAIWDEKENEIYIYNYNWNFGLIDFCVWKLIPALAFCLLVWRLVSIFKNTGTPR